MRQSGLRQAFLLVLFVALSWQSYLIGTHVHPAASLSSISSGIGTGAAQLASRDRQLPNAPDTCPICQELAQAGHYLPPAPIVFDAPLLAVALLAVVAACFPTVQRRRSHDWRSRAPPSAPRT